MADTTPVTLSEAKELRGLVRSIVVAQGNLFIRELLRNQGIRIGTNKAEFERDLGAAISASKLRLQQVREWLDEVEGWGDQHVYLYHAPEELFRGPKWKSAENIRASLPASQRKAWQPDRVLSFPEKPALTGIFFEDGALRYVWHSASETWQRTPGRDYRDNLDGDLYEFRAFRQRPDRKVRRFVVRRDIELAAIFLQTDWSQKEHEDEIREVLETVAPLVPPEVLRPFSMSQVIKRLDQLELEAGEPNRSVKAQKTRWADAQAYVEFASTNELGYMESAEVRRVRTAIRSDTLMTGANGTFIYAAKTPTGLDRPVRFDVFSEQRRVKLRSQLTAADVWTLIKLLKRAEIWQTTAATRMS